MKGELEREAAGGQVTLETMQLDLASFRSTRECADAFKAKNLPLHLLINNAGVAWLQQLSMQCCEMKWLVRMNFFPPFFSAAMTGDNHEAMFQVHVNSYWRIHVHFVYM